MAIYPILGGGAGGGAEVDPTALKIANNLSDLDNTATARTNLGLGDAATAGLLDEDDLISNDDTAAPTQQSVKAYVDNAVAGAGGGDMTTAIYDPAAKSEQVLTVGDLIDEDTLISNDDTKAPTQQSVKAYVDTSVAGLGTGDMLAATYDPDNLQEKYISARHVDGFLDSGWDASWNAEMGTFDGFTPSATAPNDIQFLNGVRGELCDGAFETVQVNPLVFLAGDLVDIEVILHPNGEDNSATTPGGSRAGVDIQGGGRWIRTLVKDDDTLYRIGPADSQVPIGTIPSGSQLDDWHRYRIQKDATTWYFWLNDEFIGSVLHTDLEANANTRLRVGRLDNAGVNQVYVHALKYNVGDWASKPKVSIKRPGTEIGQLVELEDVGGNAALPAVDGSQLLNLPNSADLITEFVVDSVNGPYMTIQSAIDAASLVGGGVVYVKAGNYPENLTAVHSVTLQGESRSSVLVNGDALANGPTLTVDIGSVGVDRDDRTFSCRDISFVARDGQRAISVEGAEAQSVSFYNIRSSTNGNTGLGTLLSNNAVDGNGLRSKVSIDGSSRFHNESINANIPLSASGGDLEFGGDVTIECVDTDDIAFSLSSNGFMDEGSGKLHINGQVTHNAVRTKNGYGSVFNRIHIMVDSVDALSLSGVPSATVQIGDLLITSTGGSTNAISGANSSCRYTPSLLRADGFTNTFGATMLSQVKLESELGKEGGYPTEVSFGTVSTGDLASDTTTNIDFALPSGITKALITRAVVERTAGLGATFSLAAFSNDDRSDSTPSYIFGGEFNGISVDPGPEEGPLTEISAGFFKFTIPYRNADASEFIRCTAKNTDFSENATFSVTIYGIPHF